MSNLISSMSATEPPSSQVDMQSLFYPRNDHEAVDSLPPLSDITLDDFYHYLGSETPHGSTREGERGPGERQSQDQETQTETIERVERIKAYDSAEDFIQKANAIVSCLPEQSKFDFF